MTARRLFAPLFALFFAAAPAGCGDDASSPVAAAAPAGVPDLAGRVVFAPLTAAREATLVTLSGEVTLPAGAVQALAPPVSGRLKVWAVSLGAQVAAGDPLATFESPDLRDLEAQERELARAADARRKLVARERAQLAEGLIGAPALYEHELMAQEAAARLEAVRAQLASRGALGADAGAEWTWRAPAPGTVSALSCAVGTMTTPDLTCVTLLAVADAELRLHVPERMLALVTPEVRAVWHPASAPEAAVTLTLSRIDPTIDPQSRTRAHYFGRPEPGPGLDRAALARLFVPGASGRADLLALAVPGLVSVPQGALTRLDGRDVVFVAPPDGAPATDAAPLPVEIVGRHEADVLVRGVGLGAGTRVAVRGAFLLKSIHALRESGGEGQ